jgi:hypothetical protein
MWFHPRSGVATHEAWQLMENESMHAPLLQWAEQRGFSPALRDFASRIAFLE